MARFGRKRNQYALKVLQRANKMGLYISNLCDIYQNKENVRSLYSSSKQTKNIWTKYFSRQVCVCWDHEITRVHAILWVWSLQESDLKLWEDNKHSWDKDHLLEMQSTKMLWENKGKNETLRIINSFGLLEINSRKTLKVVRIIWQVKSSYYWHRWEL